VLNTVPSGLARPATRQKPGIAQGWGMGAVAGLTGEVLKDRLSEGVSWPRPRMSVAAANGGDPTVVQKRRCRISNEPVQSISCRLLLV
jgi:hypothetical protein